MTTADPNQAAREEFEQKVREHMQQQHREQMEIHAQARQAAYWTKMVQDEINNTPRQQYAVIAAVDQRGGFSKDGQIPWNYPDDFKWFQHRTKGHICVMGRVTYDDINARLGDKAAVSVLPDRRCYVVTSTPLPRNNATAVASLGDVDKLLTHEDAEQGRIVFFCGGERVYREGIAKAQTAYITVVNKDVEADRFFPVSYLMKMFTEDKMFKTEATDDIRFTTWKRKV